jgi:predicted GTPase
VELTIVVNAFAQLKRRSKMMFVDPTMKTGRENISYVPRPKKLEGLRVAIIENTKKNAEAVMVRLAEKLNVAYGMKVSLLMHKPQRDPLKDEELKELKGSTDIVISGVGD